MTTIKRIISLFVIAAMLAGTIPSVAAFNFDEIIERFGGLTPSNHEYSQAFGVRCPRPQCAMTASFEGADCEHYCHQRGDPNCTQRRTIGNVTGSVGARVSDALEIAKFLVGMDSKLDDGPGSCEWNASLIISKDAPSWVDAVEILLSIVGGNGLFDSVLAGGPMPTVTAPQGLFIAEVDTKNGVINYYTTIDIVKEENVRVEFDFSVYFGGGYYKFEYINTFHNNGVKTLGSASLVALMPSQCGLYAAGKGVIALCNLSETIPAGTLVFKQKIVQSEDGPPINLQAFRSNAAVTGHSIAPMKGNVTGKGGIGVADALEILKKIVGLDSLIDKCERAREAALITELSQNSGVVSVSDALEILKYMVMIDNRILSNSIRASHVLRPVTFLDLNDKGIDDEELVAMIADGRIPQTVETLILSNNNITDITPLQNLPNLKTLVLNNNQITDILPLVNIPGLRDVYVADNDFPECQVDDIFNAIDDICVNGRSGSENLRPALPGGNRIF